MFAILEKNVSERALEAVVSLIYALEKHGADVEAIWADPYLVGFLSGIISTTVSIFSRHQIEDEMLSFTMIHVLADASALNRLDMGRLFVDHQQLSAPDFARGAQNASKMLVFFYNPHAFADDPDIVKARSAATGTNGEFCASAETEEGHAAVCQILAEDLFLNRAVFPVLG